MNQDIIAMIIRSVGNHIRKHDHAHNDILTFTSKTEQKTSLIHTNNIIIVLHFSATTLLQEVCSHEARVSSSMN